MHNEHDITVLNTLIATTLDSVKGYRDAAEKSENAQHQAFFREASEERSRAAAQMQDHVRALGGDPEMESSTAGAMHRAWLDLKSAVSGRDEQAIINEVERGEDYIKEKFEAALRDGEVTAGSRGVLEQVFESVRRGHDRASAMKHATV